MTRRQRAAAFLSELERKHWEHRERLAKAATLENATRYAEESLRSPMDSNAPTVARVKGGFLLNWPGVSE